MPCKFQKRCFLPFYILVIILNVSLSNCQNKPPDKIEKLRSKYQTMLKDEVKHLLQEKNFFDRYWNKSGDFENQFKTKTVNSKKIIIDQKTGLMWHPSGSLKFVNLKQAKNWISDMNENSYAGFSDWRLPTLEEALSLLEKRKRINLYIDKQFDTRQWCIWTGDKLDSKLNWVIVFSGRVDWFDSGVSLNYVRPVRINDL